MGLLRAESIRTCRELGYVTDGDRVVSVNGVRVTHAQTLSDIIAAASAHSLQWRRGRFVGFGAQVGVQERSKSE